MKEKVKEFLISYLPGFITGLIVCGGVSVLAMTYFPSNQTTYDNKTSGLNSTNVQGAIDELYNVCTAEPPAGEQIIENAGLEKDEYECRYFFTGSNPNNYINFNEEIWRIISVECDGTIKIMRQDSIGINTYGGNNVWDTPTSLNTYLNETYYNSLTKVAQNQIISHDFSIGINYAEGQSSLSVAIENENATKWNGKIALPTKTEYLRVNSNKSQCETEDLLKNNYNTCASTNWMVISDSWWLLYRGAAQTTYASFVNSTGSISSQNVWRSSGTIPAVYLSSDIKITGGTGTQSAPYVVN